MTTKQRILAHLARSPATLQQIADTLGLPTRTAFTSLYRLRKDGHVHPPIRRHSGRPHHGELTYHLPKDPQ